MASPNLKPKYHLMIDYTNQDPFGPNYQSERRQKLQKSRNNQIGGLHEYGHDKRVPKKLPRKQN